MKSSTSNPKTDYVYKLEKPDLKLGNAEKTQDTAEVYAIFQSVFDSVCTVWVLYNVEHFKYL